MRPAPIEVRTEPRMIQGAYWPKAVVQPPAMMEKTVTERTRGKLRIPDSVAETFWTAWNQMLEAAEISTAEWNE